MPLGVRCGETRASGDRGACAPRGCRPSAAAPRPCGGLRQRRARLPDPSGWPRAGPYRSPWAWGRASVGRAGRPCRFPVPPGIDSGAGKFQDVAYPLETVAPVGAGRHLVAHRDDLLKAKGRRCSRSRRGIWISMVSSPMRCLAASSWRTGGSSPRSRSPESSAARARSRHCSAGISRPRAPGRAHQLIRRATGAARLPACDWPTRASRPVQPLFSSLQTSNSPFFGQRLFTPKSCPKKPGPGQPWRQSAVVSHGLPQIHLITCRPSAQHLPTQGLEIFLRDASLVNRPPLSMGRPSGLPLPQVLPQHGRHVRRAGGGGESPIKTHFRLKAPAHRFPVLLADHQVAAHIKQYVADTAFFAFLPEPATVDFPVA